MREELNIMSTCPHLDLCVWAEALDEADHKALQDHQDVAIFWDPYSGHGQYKGVYANRCRFRIGRPADRPVGWKVVYVSHYVPKAKVSAFRPTLIVIGVILSAVFLLCRAVCNSVQ